LYLVLGWGRYRE
jgi:hypothetical protein